MTQPQGRCEASVYKKDSDRRCKNVAKFARNGRLYCWRHSAASANEVRENVARVIAAARAYRQAESDGTPRGKHLQDLASALDDALAAFEAVQMTDPGGDDQRSVP